MRVPAPPNALILPLAVVAALAAATPVAAACYADYKAKQDDPLRLHYGVVQLPDDACSKRAAERQIARRIAGDGWQLLNVLGVFGDEGLAERRESAGQYFLRY